VNGLVVVGSDGSASSLDAVAAAAQEARRRGAHLRVVHAFTWPALHFPLGPQVYGDADMYALADHLMSQALERVRTVAPEVDVSHNVRAGDALAVLVEESRTAHLVVVGSRGTGAFTALLVGSTGVGLAAHAHCPVLVVRGTPDATGPVLVGVDGSRAAENAVSFAFDEAAVRGTDLVALHAWTTWNVPVPAPPADPAMPYAYQPGMLAQDEERLLAEALAGCTERYPQVQVEHRSVHAATRETLLAASRKAQLLVVGARGRGGFTGLLLGSVSQAALHHAHCPVAVVREGADDGH
jgi:nucleotide-binding universal stress UspA family protein